MTDTPYNLRTQRPSRPQPHRAGRQPVSYSDHGGYIAGLDGLRALAVVAVILYHVFPGVFRGGFLGVDIFFVISGFLITTLLLREDRTRNFINLRQFWVRRARRLIPALLLLIITVVPTAWAVNPDLIVGIGRQIFGALTFSTNWVEIAHGSSYFDSTAPLLFKNFWSLAIEEQFYLFWPLIMLVILALVSTRQQRVAISGGLMFASSILMMILYTGSNHTRLYYGTDTHIFGLCAGITLAFLWADQHKKIFSTQHWKSFHTLYGWSGLITLLLFIMIMPDNGPWAYMGGMLTASIATCLVIADMLFPRSFLAQFGELSSLKWIGTRSYGLYLWHWPILVIVTALYPVAVGSVSEFFRSIIAVTLALLIVEISYRYIETPVRKQGYRLTIARMRHSFNRSLPATILQGSAVALALVTCAAVIFAPAITSTQAQIQAGGTSSLARQKNTAADNKNAPEKTEGKSAKKRPAPPKKLSADLDTTIPNTYEVTVIGDSMVSASRTGLVHAMPGINTFGEPSIQWAQAGEMISKVDKEQKLGRVVVLDFGTNGGIADPDNVRDAIEQLGVNRMIFLVNIYSPSTFVTDTNEVLKKIAGEYVNVELIDWNGLAAKKPELLQVDSTHTSIEGANAYGELIKDSITQGATKLSKQLRKDPGTGWETEAPSEESHTN